MIATFNIEIVAITPLVRLRLFMLGSDVSGVQLKELVVGVFVFVVLLAVGFVLLLRCPQIALFLAEFEVMSICL